MNKNNGGLIDLYSTMNEQDMLVYYKGPFDDVILAEIGNKIRKKAFESPKVGKRLFAGGAIPAGFELLESGISSSGVIIASYERAGEVKTGSLGLETPSEAELVRRKRLKEKG